MNSNGDRSFSLLHSISTEIIPPLLQYSNLLNSGSQRNAWKKYRASGELKEQIWQLSPCGKKGEKAPDRPFQNFRASRSGDRSVLYSSESCATDLEALGLVGYLNSRRKRKLGKSHMRHAAGEGPH